MKGFVTGATGYIGSAVVRQLIADGHEVVGLARSSEAAQKLADAGAVALPGSLEELDALRNGAQRCDAVAHLGFVHDFTDFAHCCQIDRQAVTTLGETLAGSGRPLVIASGLAGLDASSVVTEDFTGNPDQTASPRLATEQTLIGMVSAGVRVVSVRLPPTVHGPGDHGFVAQLVATTRDRQVSANVGDGSNRWPAVHVEDAAHLFCLALEEAPTGSRLHAVAEEGVPFGQIATSIATGLDLPLISVSADKAVGYFGWLGGIVGLDTPASSAATRALLGWMPIQPGLLDDLGSGCYFTGTTE
ncbi:MAG: SDR family oxidoreductase [Propionibacteriaceae bacterium]|nr:SDR family oxidoreductase [Propionibacteriaceae bacterium]